MDEILLSDSQVGTISETLQRIAACRELMQRLADGEDNPEAFPDESCVWGLHDHPGTVDIQLLVDRPVGRSPPAAALAGGTLTMPAGW